MGEDALIDRAPSTAIIDNIHKYAQAGNSGSGNVQEGPTPIVNSNYTKKSKKLIDTLHPSIRESASEFVDGCNAAGIDILIYSGVRSIEDQNKIYSKGRDENGNIVDRAAVRTGVKGGYSFHNYGLAFDAVEVKDGAALWSNDNLGKIGAIGKEAGFGWGGDMWPDFIDKPHFQNSFDYTTSQLLERYNDGNKTDGFVNLE